MSKIKILFDDGSMPFILEALGYSIDNEGFVIYDKLTPCKGLRAKDSSRKEFKATDIKGLIKGEFITTDEQLSNIDLSDWEDMSEDEVGKEGIAHYREKFKLD